MSKQASNPYTLSIKVKDIFADHGIPTEIKFDNVLMMVLTEPDEFISFQVIKSMFENLDFEPTYIDAIHDRIRFVWRIERD